MNIAVAGSGHVGVSSAALIAQQHEIIAAGIDETHVQKIIQQVTAKKCIHDLYGAA